MLWTLGSKMYLAHFDTIESFTVFVLVTFFNELCYTLLFNPHTSLLISTIKSNLNNGLLNAYLVWNVWLLSLILLFVLGFSGWNVTAFALHSILLIEHVWPPIRPWLTAIVIRSTKLNKNTKQNRKINHLGNKSHLRNSSHKMRFSMGPFDHVLRMITHKTI